MQRTKLIECFKDTYNLSWSPELQDATEKSILSNKVYKEDMVIEHRQQSRVTNHEKRYPFVKPTVEENVYVCEGTTFATAREYVHEGRVAVLNFANPVNPGGGVANGAMAQEECLCRSSNLYACLKAENVQDEYYAYHKQMQEYFFSDRLIYTRDVTVFKSDDEVPVLMPDELWFQVDVITCAAPYVAKRKYTNKAVLKEVFKSRIKNIFEAALDNGAEVLILGAFGCGAFKNPPKIVAQAFSEVIGEREYRKQFKKIVFAIKHSHGDGINVVCPNLLAFEMELTGRSSKLCKVHSSEKTMREYDYEDYIPRQFSILGDSISTLEGFNPSGYKVFFEGDKCELFGVREMSDTWWGKVIKFFGGELLVNNSWSGSRVTKLPNSVSLFPSGCSDERTNGLHIGNVKPDVIIVYLGTNDWAFGAMPAFADRLPGEEFMPWYDSFEIAYEKMLQKLKTNYPEAEIWCCTIPTTDISTKPNFSFPYTYGGTHIEEYNHVIREQTRYAKCKLIDLYAKNSPYDTLDGSHPTASGMSTLATMIIREISERIAEVDNNMVYEELYPTEDLSEAEIRLTNKGTEQVIKLKKNVFHAGRSAECDLFFDKEHRFIARVQATFYYENGRWYLKDNYSTNGTWLNSKKIEGGEKYLLKPNDEIDFAHSEIFIFEKTAGQRAVP